MSGAYGVDLHGASIDPAWGTCQVCRREMRLRTDGRIPDHRHRPAGRPRYESVPCVGGRLLPAEDRS